MHKCMNNARSQTHVVEDHRMKNESEARDADPACFLHLHRCCVSCVSSPLPTSAVITFRTTTPEPRLYVLSDGKREYEDGPGTRKKEQVRLTGCETARNSPRFGHRSRQERTGKGEGAEADRAVQVSRKRCGRSRRWRLHVSACSEVHC